MTAEEDAFVGAIKNTQAQAAREDLCRLTNNALNDYGLKLFVAGNAIAGGPSKAQDPDLKDLLERLIGLSCVMQTAGELGTASASLLEAGQFYASFALVRQIVECEYLCWAFAQDQDDARKWLNTTRSERLRFWSPARMRERSGDEFRAKDYAVHCELGGHPTPRAFALLKTSRTMHGNSVWLELAVHLANVWSHTTRAIPSKVMPLLDRKPGSYGRARDVTAAVNEWLSSDPALVGRDLLPDFPALE